MPAFLQKTVALAAGLSFLSGAAVAFTAQNQMRVEQTAASDIAVAFFSQAGDTDYWCAAGDFASRVLRVPSTTLLYRSSPKPRGQGQGIAFTLDPARAAAGAGLASFGAGSGADGVTVGQAVGSFCQPMFSRN